MKYVFAMAVTAVMASPAIAAAEPADLIIRHATIVDVAKGRTKADQAVVVRDGNIIAVGPDRNIWFTKGAIVGRVTPDGMMTEFPLPPTTGGGTGLTAGSDRQPPMRLSNRLWVAASGGNKLVSLSFK